MAICQNVPHVLNPYINNRESNQCWYVWFTWGIKERRHSAVTIASMNGKMIKESL